MTRVLITGGTRGVGRELARMYLDEGAKVAVTYRSSEQDAVMLTELGARVFQGDVAERAHADEVLKTLAADWGGLDALACCAGLNQVYPLALIDDDDWDAVMRTNVKGAFVFSRAAAKQMIKQKHGSIALFGSFANERFIESAVHYNTAKAALRGLTESLSLELGRYAIRVNLIAPGVLDTGSSSALPQHRLDDYLAHNPMGRTGTAPDIARAARFVLDDKNAFMTGSKLVVDGGI